MKFKTGFEISSKFLVRDSEHSYISTSSKTLPKKVGN